MKRPLLFSAGVVAALVVASTAITLLPGGAPQARAEGLVPYDDCDALLDHYRGALEDMATPWGFGMWGGPWLVGDGAFAEAGTADAGVPVPAAAAAGSADWASSGDTAPASGGSGPTGTNLQERGVDEPDKAKTSGDLLLAIAHNRLQLLRAGDTPELLSSTPLGQEAWGAELLVDGDRVLVLNPHGGFSGHMSRSSGPWGGGGHGTTRLTLLDIADPSSPTVLEEMAIDGRYLSARLSDGAVRLVTSAMPSPASTHPAPPHGPEAEAKALEGNRRSARRTKLEQVLPQVERRDASGRTLAKGAALDCEDVRHPPSPRGASTLLVTTLDLQRGLEPRDADAVTTDGDLVYASADRLYVATSRWGTTAPPPDDRPDTSTADIANEVTTELHAFDTTSPDRTAYAGSGSVPGYLMGRWALSSHEGHLRVATTMSPPWQSERKSSSSVLVLEEQPDRLQLVGRVDGLGLDERIYAVRYFGDLATVVTFRETDPLYVLDLGDPAEPKVLGELKIPGFSTYLHPAGDGLLLGVGQDADERGRVTGMQVSLFDLTDRTKPVQVDRISLGEGWTPASHDSRAFGWDAARQTALLPFSAWDGRSQQNSALGIRVTPERTLVEAGRMELMADAPPERVLHDGERLYAVTHRGVAAGELDDLRRLGATDFGR